MRRDEKSAVPEGRGTELTRFNALRHGILSRYTVLPWEDADEYRMLLEALVAEHTPQGATEEHLVEELAGVLWRKRRLRLAEAATHRRGLQRTLGTHSDTTKAALVHVDSSDSGDRVIDAIRMTDADTVEERTDLAADEAMTRAALEILDGGQADAYDACLAALREDTREWWADDLARDREDREDDEEPATPDPDGLRVFLTDKVLRWFEDRAREIDYRPLVRDQAYGEALDPDKLERLGRYEVHLDRKFERTLSMLLKLKDLRRPAMPG